MITKFTDVVWWLVLDTGEYVIFAKLVNAQQRETAFDMLMQTPVGVLQ